MPFHLRRLNARKPALFMLAFSVAFTSPSGVSAQTTPTPTQTPTQTSKDVERLEKDLASLRAAQDEIRRELYRLKGVIEELTEGLTAGSVEVEPPEPAVDAVIPVAGKRFLGKVDAPVTVFEFADFECQHCAHHSAVTLPVLMEDYIEAGLVKYVIVDYPVDGHDNAPMAAEAARCAAEQSEDLYWKMRAAIYPNYDSITKDNLLLWAEGAGVENIDALKQCLDEERYAEAVNNDILDGNRAGMYSTPTFYIGLTHQQAPAEGMVRAVEKMEGAYPYSDFRYRIESMLGNYPR